jgi:hypothetical protein
MTAALWEPPGPVGAAFLENENPISVLMGPVGSAKTTTGLMRGHVMSYLWPAAPSGVRKVKFGVIRRLQKDLEKTTMASWNQWFPRNMGVWRGGAGDPATHELALTHPGDGLPIHMTVEFIALGDQRVEEAMRGWEGSFAYIDEVDLMLPETLAWVWSRCGRYPRETIGINPKLAWGTCNAPEFDNWVLTDFLDKLRDGHKLFRQPGGLDPNAENMRVLPANFYTEMLKVLKPDEARRMVHNQPGISKSGTAVYQEFNDDIHMAKEPLDILDRPLIIGMDAGGTPAAGFWQRAANGQWRKLRELSTHEKIGGSITGPTRFGEELAEILADRFRGLAIRAHADPSAAHGADTRNGEASWIDTVARVANIAVAPAPTNDPTPRQEALRLPMTRLIDGRVPGLLIDPSCTLTRKALSRDYFYPLVRSAGTVRQETKPAKNWASHLVEADQYALLDGGAYHEVLGRGQKRAQATRPILRAAQINVFATQRMN